MSEREGECDGKRGGMCRKERGSVEESAGCQRKRRCVVDIVCSSESGV